MDMRGQNMDMRGQNMDMKKCPGRTNGEISLILRLETFFFGICPRCFGEMMDERWRVGEKR